jgi:hypothetical protein
VVSVDRRHDLTIGSEPGPHGRRTKGITMALVTATTTTTDIIDTADPDDVEGQVYRLGARLDHPEGPDVSLVHSMALSGIDRRFRRSYGDPGAVVDEDKPRRLRFRRRH